jgi:site-specific DNA-methyltransferase (adenine-specific)
MIKLNTIEVSDAISYLNKIENETIDLMVCDPPYGIAIDDWDVFQSEEEYFNFIYSWLEISLLKLKPTGSIYLFNNSYNSAMILSFLKDKNVHFQNWLTWYKKDGFTALTKKYNRVQETILFLTKDKKKYTFNYNEIRVPYESSERIKSAEKKGILKNGKRWFPNKDGKLCGDVWEFSSEKNRNRVNGKTVKQFHATPKPLEMIKRIIKASSNKGDVVLDLFMGSGTTALACKELNRNFLGCDINSEYVEYSMERLKQF